MKLCRTDVGKQSKAKGTLNPSPKKRFNPIEKSSYSLSPAEIVHAVSAVCKEADCIIYTDFPKPAIIAPLQEEMLIKTR